ncbi:creatininase family protein [Streptomyces sp. NPDC051051]|uniref:creatininase family protein n=1 Tax=Streptomyces sp. NPDC051051 TaxID=3155666 RepID=UPI003433F8F4
MSENRWNRPTASELREPAQRDAVVLMPVGSNEQHGEHLPTGVDDFLALKACRKAADVPMVIAPSVWCGLVEHRMPFGGTVTLPLPTLHALLRDVCRSSCAPDSGTPDRQRAWRQRHRAQRAGERADSPRSPASSPLGVR